MFRRTSSGRWKGKGDRRSEKGARVILKALERSFEAGPEGGGRIRLIPQVIDVIQGNRLLCLTTSSVDRLGDQGLSGWGRGLLILPWEVQTHRCLSHYRT